MGNWKVVSGSGGGDAYEKIVFGLNNNLVVGDDLNPHYISLFEQDLETCLFKVKVAPTGQDVHCQVRVNSTSDLFSSSIVVPAGDNTVQLKNDFNIPSLHFMDVLTFNISQIGSTVVGATLTVFIRAKITGAPTS
jgi:hypothetical protein